MKHRPSPAASGTPLRRARTLALLLASLLLAAPPASAQDFDLTGEWASRTHEDLLHRTMPGPDLGDYTGLPLNDAGRQKADSWDPMLHSQIERQAQPHPAVYSSRGPSPTLFVSEIRSEAGALQGYRIAGYYGRADRTIWMDGRPHPSERYGEHTWAGFSTGRWENGRLVVTTTHIKMGVVQRNGSATSPYARMTEIYSRHDSLLTLFSWVDDPIYLEEPMVRTQSWMLRRTAAESEGPPPLQAFEPVEEVSDRPEGWVAHYPLGTEPRRFADLAGLPFEATRGGKASLYPEYAKVIEQLRRDARRAGRR
ncbi:MAG: hypothetical protein HOP14_14465 [Acidobacteria bacterium]|nr:hypothetical protein [Acidobacteriota bacterium]